jgi:hypothetical protein
MQFVGSLSDWWLYQSGTSQLTDYLKSPRTILGDSDLTFILSKAICGAQKPPLRLRASFSGLLFDPSLK